MSLEQWTLLREAFPASHLASREIAEERQTTAISGQKCCALLSDVSPLSCLSKMLLVSSQWYSTRYRLTWSPMATTCGRLYFRLRPSARPIGANGVSLWATPDTRNAQDGTHLRREAEVAMEWPTPSAQEPGWRHITVVDKNGNPPQHHHQRFYDAKTGRVVQKGLTQVVEKMWPTPRASDGEHGGPNQRDSAGKPGLTGAAALWSTPAAQDSKNATLPVSQATRDTLPGDVIRTGATGKLNPDWVESLMGFPPGWTVLAGPPVPVKRSTGGKRRARSRAKSPTVQPD